MTNGRRPNVVWVVIDALRADHTTMVDYGRDTTPNLRRIAARSDGAHSPDCFSHSIATRPSVSSMMTGVYPSAHGVNMIEGAIPDELPTVAELLGQVGYHTVAVSRNSHVSAATGLDRGFNEFDWFGSARSLVETVDLDILLDYLLRIRHHSVGFSTDLVEHSIAYVVNQLAKRHVRRIAGTQEPFFMFLHYLGPHGPYVPPVPYQDRYLDELDYGATEAVELMRRVQDHVWEYNTGKRTLSDPEVAALGALYDAEVAYTDDRVGDLFDFVTAQPLERETNFVVTADHGELLGERGIVGHEFYLDDELVHVPLVVHGPMSTAIESDGLVQHADLVETLLAQVHGDHDHTQGVDLRRETRDHVVLERCQPLDFDDLREFNPSFDESSVPGTGTDTVAIRDREFKLVRSDDGDALYELPDERTDVSGDYPDSWDRLQCQLDQWERDFATPAGRVRKAELDADMQRQLSELGYLTE
jgi:uncharacterized sulfatase